jgi:hypothetical protein
MRPGNLIEQVESSKSLRAANKIILMQAANTGMTSRLKLEATD